MKKWNKHFIDKVREKQVNKIMNEWLIHQVTDQDVQYFWTYVEKNEKYIRASKKILID